MSAKITAGFVALFLLVLTLSILLGRSASPVSALPQLPHAFFGLITADGGTPVSAGTSLKARINNVHFGQSVIAGSTTQSTSIHAVNTVDGTDYNYGSLASYRICADDPATTPIEGGINGNTITFFVAGIQATPDATFTRGALTLLKRISASALSLGTLRLSR